MKKLTALPVSNVPLAFVCGAPWWVCVLLLVVDLMVFTFVCFRASLVDPIRTLEHLYSKSSTDRTSSS